MRAGVRAGVGGAPRRALGVAHSGRDRQSTAKVRCGLALRYKLALGAPHSMWAGSEIQASPGRPTSPRAHHPEKAGCPLHHKPREEVLHQPVAYHDP